MLSNVPSAPSSSRPSRRVRLVLIVFATLFQTLPLAALCVPSTLFPLMA